MGFFRISIMQAHLGREPPKQRVIATCSNNITSSVTLILLNIFVREETIKQVWMLKTGLRHCLSYFNKYNKSGDFDIIKYIWKRGKY